MKNQEKRTPGQAWLRFLFVVYGGAMLWLLFGQRIERSIFCMQLPIEMETYKALLEGNINLTPLVTIRRYWYILQTSVDRALLNHAVINLVGNVVMFVPLGIFLPGIFLKKPTFFGCFFAVVLIIAAVEAIQFFTLLGSLDIDDLILNLAGAIVGYIIWRICNKPCKRR